MMYGMAASDLGTRIQRARGAKRLSQEQLAAAVGKSVRTVGRWEQGKATPRGAEIGALEVILAPYFSAGDEKPALPTDPVERQLYDLAVVDGGAEGAWAVVEEYRRRVRRRAG